MLPEVYLFIIKIIVNKILHIIKYFSMIHYFQISDYVVIVSATVIPNPNSNIMQKILLVREP